MIPDLAHYVRVPREASELQLGDRVLLDGTYEPWTVDRLDAATVRRTPAVISASPNSDYAGPHLELDNLRDRVTLLVEPTEIPTPRPHGARIVAHNPIKRGWYTDPGGYDVACGCGWHTDSPVSGSRALARQIWLTHKASVITTLLEPRAAVLVTLPNAARHYPVHRRRLIRLTPAHGGER